MSPRGPPHAPAFPVVQAEELLGEKGLPFSCFRPQYIYGPKQGKSYLVPLFDRACREQHPPQPVPNPQPNPARA